MRYENGNGVHESTNDSVRQILAANNLLDDPSPPPRTLPQRATTTDIPALTGEAVRKHHENLAAALGDMLVEKQRAHDAEQALRQQLHDEFVANTHKYIERIQEEGKLAAADITKQMRETAERVRAMEEGKGLNGGRA